MMNLPMAAAAPPALDESEIAELQMEVRELALTRGAVILAHNYQLPEVQDLSLIHI